MTEEEGVQRNRVGIVVDPAGGLVRISGQSFA